jgi:very-short-patch-repair endonuclease
MIEEKERESSTMQHSSNHNHDDYQHSSSSSSFSSFYKRPKPTRYENLLSIALNKFAPNVKYIRNSEVWLSACIWYTPDFIIGHRLVVEVDGGIHEFEYRKTPDRIRQRALENMGYYVYRVKNEEIKNSPRCITEKIIELYYKVLERENESVNSIKKPKIQKIVRPDYKSLPYDLQQLITPWTIAFNSQLRSNGNWTTSYFKDTLSNYDQRLVTNQCAMERLILQLLGLNLRKQADGAIDFEHHSILFNKAMEIISDLFGSNTSSTYLQNSFNITAPNFIKNLVFEGGPKINPRIVSITDSTNLEYHIENFNQNFSKLGVSVERFDVMVECIKELEKKKKIYYYDDNQDTDNKRKFDYQWLIKWCNSSY